MKTLKVLARLELINLLEINEIRHGKDPAARRRKGILLGTFLFLFVVLAGYVTAQAVGLAALGQAKAIPMLYFAVSFIFTLLFGIYTAKSVIYREKDRELMAVLPLKSITIVSARMLRLYLTGFLLSALIMIPAMIVYGISTGSGPLLYLFLVPACVILPILPTALAAWVGILLTAIIARNRHKVLTEVLLALIVVVGMFLLGAGLSARTGAAFSASGLESAQMNEQITVLVAEALTGFEKKLPLMKRMGDILGNADLARLLLYALISLAILCPTVIVIGRSFFSLMERLLDVRTHREYQMEALKSRSVMTALVKKEASLYFSSGIYVSNTIVGPVLAVMLALAPAFVDLSEITAGIPMSMPMDVMSALPYFLGLTFCLVSISSSSVSMEGRSWWIPLTLPVRGSEMLGAKILFNLLVVAPFYALAEIIMLFTVSAGLLQRLWLILIPAAAILFSVLFGLFLNLKMPKFNWGTAAEVVKQGAPVGFGMVAALVVALFGVGAMFLPGVWHHLIGLFFLILMAALSLFLYRTICRMDIRG